MRKQGPGPNGALGPGPKFPTSTDAATTRRPIEWRSHSEETRARPEISYQYRRGYDASPDRMAQPFARSAIHGGNFLPLSGNPS